jgi:hypothetical protein
VSEANDFIVAVAGPVFGARAAGDRPYRHVVVKWPYGHFTCNTLFVDQAGGLVNEYSAADYLTAIRVFQARLDIDLIEKSGCLLTN